jgi:hypothetical protein
MKKIYFFLIFQISLSTCYAQNFEGKIIYKVIFKDSIDNFTYSSIMQEYFKDGNLKVISSDSLYQWSLYINSENKYYTKLANSDTLRWTDGALNHDSIISIQINKNVIKILGYNCNELIMTCNNGIKKYYYSPLNFKTDAKQFIKYKSGNWTDFLLITNSLPLMQIEDNKNTHTQIVAIETMEMKLDDTFFKLPKNSILSKN